jgi:PqqD family protein of HPr-rel-A system
VAANFTDGVLPRYRALPQDAVLSVPLGMFSACYLRRTGQTHLIVQPAPQIVEALGAGPADAALVIERLSSDYDLASNEDPAAASDPGAALALVGEALDELSALGLVTRLDD